MSSDLEQLLSQDSLDMDAIGAVLDGMSAEARLAAVRKIHKAPQRRLYEAAAGRTGLSLDYMVPSERGELQEVIHEGHNSLPMFTLFQKRFARMPSSPNELCGYNEQGMTKVGEGERFRSQKHGLYSLWNGRLLPCSQPPKLLRNQ